MAGGNNDLNLFLKAKVVKLRAELDVKGSMPKIKQQVDSITQKLKNKPIRLKVKLDAKVSELRADINLIQNKLKGSKSFKPIKLDVRIDVNNSIKNIKKQLDEVYRTINEFNKKYGDQIRRMQEQTQRVSKEQSKLSSGATISTPVVGFDFKTYAKQVKDAEKLMKETFGKGLFTSFETRDAEGNLIGFIAQLEKANGVVQRIKYQWNEEAKTFTPINQQTIDAMEKQVQRATQALSKLYAEVAKLKDGAGKNNLLKEFDELEKRIDRGTLTQDAVKDLQRRIKEEQVLQQLVEKENVEYYKQQKLIDAIARARDKALKQAIDESEIRRMDAMINSVQNDSSSENLRKQALELSRINAQLAEKNRLEKEALANETKRGNVLMTLQKIERNTVSTDQTSRQLIQEIKLMTQRAKSAQDWLEINKKINTLKLNNQSDKDLQKALDLSFKLEQQYKRLYQLGKMSQENLYKNIAEIPSLASRGLADLERQLAEYSRRVKQVTEEMKEAASQDKVLLSPTDDESRVLYRKIESAIKTSDVEALKEYLSQIYKGEVATIKMTKATDSLGRTVDRLKIHMAGSGKTVKTFTVDLDRLNRQLKQVGSGGLDYNINRNLNVLEQLRIALARVPVWMTAMTAFYGSIRSVRAMADQILEVDKALTELRRVASSNIDISYVFDNALKMSKELGNNIHDVIDSVNDLARTFGDFNERQLMAITKTVTLMSNVSDMSPQEAAQTLVGTMNAFNIQAEESIRIVDSLNEVNFNSLPL